MNKIILPVFVGSLLASSIAFAQVQSQVQPHTFQQPQQSQPASDVDKDFNDATNAMVGIAENRAIEGPEELKATRLFLDTRKAWFDHVRQQVDVFKKNLQDKLAAVEKERDEAVRERNEMKNQLTNLQRHPAKPSTHK